MNAISDNLGRPLGCNGFVALRRAQRDIPGQGTVVTNVAIQKSGPGIHRHPELYCCRMLVGRNRVGDVAADRNLLHRLVCTAEQFLTWLTMSNPEVPRVHAPQCGQRSPARNMLVLTIVQMSRLATAQPRARDRPPDLGDLAAYAIVLCTNLSQFGLHGTMFQSL